MNIIAVIIYNYITTHMILAVILLLLPYLIIGRIIRILFSVFITPLISYWYDTDDQSEESIHDIPLLIFLWYIVYLFIWNIQLLIFLWYIVYLFIWNIPLLIFLWYTIYLFIWNI